MSSYFYKWAECQKIELKFWDNWIAKRGDQWPDDFLKRLDQDKTCDASITSLINRKTANPKVLDVGAGPLSIFPPLLSDGRKVELTAVDSLAEEFADRLKKNDITPLTQTISVSAEKLDDSFPDNYFDFVYVRNALDQTYDPFASLEMMLKVVRKGSNIFLSHQSNLAAREEYSGTPQWNLTADHDSLIVWNYNRRVNISKELAAFAKITVIHSGSWIDVVIRKHQDL